MPSAGEATAGITGHQQLEDEQWVRSQLRNIIDREGVVHGVTSLARGADQIFAECLLDAGAGYSVIVPSGGYEDTFETSAAKQSYEHLLRRAVRIETLRYGEPSEEAFLAAGQRMVDETSVIIAVWDGKPAKGVGGTGDVVAYAKSHGKRVIHVNCADHAVSDL